MLLLLGRKRPVRRQTVLAGWVQAKFLRAEAVLQFIPIAAEFLLAQGGDRRVKGGSGRCGLGSTPSVMPGTSPAG